MGSWFEAKRAGKCSNCGKAVAKGDELYAKTRGVYLCSECGLVAENTSPDMGKMEAAVELDLSKLPPEVHDMTIAQSMLYMARQLDQGDVSPREVKDYTKELRLNLMTLQDMFPAEEEGDDTDNAREKRARRMNREQGGF